MRGLAALCLLLGLGYMAGVLPLLIDDWHKPVAAIWLMLALLAWRTS